MERVITNPTAAFGLALADTSMQDAQPLVSAESSTTITAGQIVTAATGTNAGKILQATTSVVALFVIGIALEDIAAGGEGMVATWGVVTNAKTQGTVNAGDVLTRSGTTAGSVAAITQAATDLPGSVVGFALTTAASNLATVFFMKL